MKFAASALVTCMGASAAVLVAGCSGVSPGPAATQAQPNFASTGGLVRTKDLPMSSVDWTLTECQLLGAGVCKLFIEVGATGLPATLPAADQDCQLTVSTYATTRMKKDALLRWMIVPLTGDGYKYRFAARNGVVFKENNNVYPGQPRPAGLPLLFEESQTATTAEKKALVDVVNKPFIYTIFLEWQPPGETRLWGRCIALDPLIVNSN